MLPQIDKLNPYDIVRLIMAYQADLMAYQAEQSFNQIIVDYPPNVQPDFVVESTK